MLKAEEIEKVMTEIEKENQAEAEKKAQKKIQKFFGIKNRKSFALCPFYFFFIIIIYSLRK